MSDKVGLILDLLDPGCMLDAIVEIVYQHLKCLCRTHRRISLFFQ